MKIKWSLISSIFLIGFTSVFATPVQKGNMMIRLKALDVMPNEKSTITPIGGQVKVKDTVVPQIDFTYFFTQNIAAEIIAATTPHKMFVENSSVGAVNAGKVWLLPPILSIQYHFTNLVEPLTNVKPYIGAGLNYTIFYNKKSGSLRNVNYKNRFGFALQAGIDIPLHNNWYVNFDFKKLWLKTTARFNDNTIVAKVRLDPCLLSTGIGFRF